MTDTPKDTRYCRMEATLEWIADQFSEYDQHPINKAARLALGHAITVDRLPKADEIPNPLGTIDRGLMPDLSAEMIKILRGQADG